MSETRGDNVTWCSQNLDIPTVEKGHPAVTHDVLLSVKPEKPWD